MPTDSFLSVAFAFWLSHIARYASSPARQNLLAMNDPKFTFIFKQPLITAVYQKKFNFTHYIYVYFDNAKLQK